jgi:hypothetical protein
MTKLIGLYKLQKEEKKERKVRIASLFRTWSIKSKHYSLVGNMFMYYS